MHSCIGERSTSNLTLPNTAGIPDWTSRKNNLELIELSSVSAVSLVSPL